MSITTLAEGSRPPIKNKMEKFTFTLGKLDAGMAILLGPNAHLLEFPSLLLPTPGPNTPPLGPGSILTITVTRDLQAEDLVQRSFSTLQEDILDAYTRAPSAPKLKVRSVTQTSVVLDWDKIDVGSADFRALEMWKNGQRLGRVGGEFGKKDKEKKEWKTGGLQVGGEFAFHLVLKTTAGTFTSNKIKVKTHTMDNLTGLNIFFGPIQPESLLDQLRSCLSEIGAKESKKLEIDTTHFVCTTPLVGGDDQGRGGAVSREYAEAVQANLPVVGPGWLMAVAGERKLVPISSHLLPPMPTNVPVADPAPFKRPEPLKRASLPFTSSAPGSPIQDIPPRSPSPETIARMSYTSGVSSSQPPKRQDSLDATERRRTMSAESTAERKRGREATFPLDPRPKSPKPEADGKLDRGFVFPVVSPTTPTTGNGPDSAVSDAPITGSSVQTEEILAKSPAETPLGPQNHVEGGSAAPGGPIGDTAEEKEDVTDRTASSSAGAIPVDIPTATTTTAPPTILSESQPESETFTSSPPTTSSSLPNAQAETQKPRASTIDEAISNFHAAVKTPEPDSLPPSSPIPEHPRTPVIALNGTPLEGDFEQVDLALEEAASYITGRPGKGSIGDLAEDLEAVDLGDETSESPSNGGETPASLENGHDGADEKVSGESSEVPEGAAVNGRSISPANGGKAEEKEKPEVKTSGGGKGGKKGKGKRGGKGGR